MEVRKIGKCLEVWIIFPTFAAEIYKITERLSDMADYKKFFKRENFIASMQAAKERKQKWEREVQEKSDQQQP